MSHDPYMRDRFHHRDDFHHRNRFRQRNFQYYQQKRHRSRIFFGITVAIFGILCLFRALGLFYFDIEDSWQVILIVIGVLIGAKSGFRNHAWWILILIGAANLIPEFPIMGHSSEQLIWPAVLIIGGLMVAMRPRRHTFNYDKKIPNMETKINASDTLNVDVVFGGRKEIVTSKNFRGGFVSATFGGADINLMQADSPDQEIVMEFKVSFGGAEVIVPSHWEIQNEISPSFGSVEDERIVQTSAGGTEERKKLILRGSCSFGSIEIKSY